MISPMTVAEIANATNPVAAKLRRRNRRRAAMGAAAKRSSYITNPAKATAAAANRATIAGLAQPAALPRISANISAVSATVIRAVPVQSARPPAGLRDSRSRATPPANAATPMGRLTKKRNRQPRGSVSTEPAPRPPARGGAGRRGTPAAHAGRGGGEEHRAADSLQRPEQLQRQRGPG